MIRNGRRALWLWGLLPILFLFVLYRDGLRVWFLADDFAWLGLLRQVPDFHSLLVQLFAPAAQGTIRPWSERGFFLLFEALFGLNPLPFRLMAFLTMSADLLLLAWITARISGSRAAGVVAAVCWAANAGLATVMTWSSAYNEVLCSFFLLSALAALIGFEESRRRVFWWLQVVLFTLGFGALEINVVYPALAAAYVLFAAAPENRRKLLRSLIPLFVVSVVYFGLHRYFAPLPSSGPYQVHLDSRILNTMALYLKWSLIPVDWRAFGHSAILGSLLFTTEIVAIVALIAGEIRNRNARVCFFPLWFLIALVPVLPLPDHRTDYYLTIPLLGLAMLAGWGFSRKPALALIPIAAYLTLNIPVANGASHWWYEKSVGVRSLVLSVEAAHHRHPGKAIVLNGIPLDLYNNSLAHSAFYPLGIDDVYLAPGSDLPGAALDPAVLQHAISNESVVLYSFAGDHLRNVTEEYERSAPNRIITRLPDRLDAGNPLYSWLLGPEWLSPEGGFRWMPGQASVRLAGPQRSGSKLRLEGFCPEEQLKEAPRRLTVTADGKALGEAEINDPETSFVRLFELPDSLKGRDSVRIDIRVTPVEHKDGQDYGLIFGHIAIQDPVL